MFDEFNGIPAHPLIVHFTIVFVVLMLVGAVAYTVVPPLRRRIGWVVVLLAIGGPVAALLARKAGESLETRLIAKGMRGDALTAIDEHQRYGNLTLYFSLGLAVALLALVAVSAARGRARGAAAGGATAGPQPRPVMLVVAVLLSVIVLVLVGFTAFYVFQAGDSGARMVWT